MNVVSRRETAQNGLLTEPVVRMPQGGVMQDLAFVGLTIGVFTLLYLLLKGVERFER